MPSIILQASSNHTNFFGGVYFQGAGEETPFLLFEFFSFCLISSLFLNTPFWYLSFLIYICFFFSLEIVNLEINNFILQKYKNDVTFATP